MADPFDDDIRPEPDEPSPPGVTPNHPKDPSVYGSQWGDSGGGKPDGRPPPDRPHRIEDPNKGDQPQDGGAAASNID